ncbi:MAG: hypothetical protein JWM98_473 [Thermoleophilia bacterium]|nr:hypothetical protein [Thermoleophilia bacterium]
MRAIPIKTQAGLFGLAAAGVSLYASADPKASDRTRIATAGMAGIFGLASAMGGFHVWAAINAGAVVGTLAGIPLARSGADGAAQGASSVAAPSGPS